MPQRNAPKISFRLKRSELKEDVKQTRDRVRVHTDLTGLIAKRRLITSRQFPGAISPPELKKGSSNRIRNLANRFNSSLKAEPLQGVKPPSLKGARNRADYTTFMELVVIALSKQPVEIREKYALLVDEFEAIAPSTKGRVGIAAQERLKQPGRLVGQMMKGKINMRLNPETKSFVDLETGVNRVAGVPAPKPFVPASGKNASLLKTPLKKFVRKNPELHFMSKAPQDITTRTTTTSSSLTSSLTSSSEHEYAVNPISIMSGFDVDTFTVQDFIDMGLTPRNAREVSMRINSVVTERTRFVRSITKQDIDELTGGTLSDRDTLLIALKLNKKILSNFNALTTSEELASKEPPWNESGILPTNNLLDLADEQTERKERPIVAPSAAAVRDDTLDATTSNEPEFKSQPETQAQAQADESKTETFGDSPDPMIDLRNPRTLANMFNSLSDAPGEWLAERGITPDIYRAAERAHSDIVAAAGQGLNAGEIERATNISVRKLGQVMRAAESVVPTDAMRAFEATEGLLGDPRRTLTETGAAVVKEVGRRGLEAVAQGGDLGHSAEGVLTDMPAIIANAAESAAQGAFSRGAGGVGDLANPQAAARLSQTTQHVNIEGGLVQPQMRGVNPGGYLGRHNPVAAGQYKGSVKIKRRPIRKVSSRRGRSQTDMVRQSVGNFKAYRDIFNTSFE